MKKPIKAEEALRRMMIKATWYKYMKMDDHTVSDSPGERRGLELEQKRQ